MAQCIKCGKKGLLLQLFKGLCYDCAKSKAEELRRLASEAAKAEADEVAAKAKAEREVQEARRIREEHIQTKIKEFEHVLLSIPRCVYELSCEKMHRLPLSDLNNLTYSSVTKKTNIKKFKKFIVIDIETTGIGIQGNEIIEISALKFVNFEPIEAFSTLIKPRKDIPVEATHINGITNKMVCKAPEIGQVIPALQTFISGFNLVGHNLEFDLRFLYRSGLDVLSEKRKFYDTLRIAQSILKKPKKKRNYDVEDHKLITLCDYYDIHRSNEHRSSSDCLATGYLFKKLIDERMHS